MQTVKQEIEWLDRKISQLQTLREELYYWPEPGNGLSVSTSYVGPVIKIYVSTLEGVQSARHYLRRVYGNWKDNLAIIYTGGTTVYAKFCNPNKKQVEIILQCNYKDFPKELQDETCGFQEILTKEVKYVCRK
jgi:hypothetical protein